MRIEPVETRQRNRSRTDAPPAGNQGTPNEEAKGGSALSQLRSFTIQQAGNWAKGFAVAAAFQVFLVHPITLLLHARLGLPSPNQFQFMIGPAAALLRGEERIKFLRDAPCRLSSAVELMNAESISNAIKEQGYWTNDQATNIAMINLNLPTWPVTPFSFKKVHLIDGVLITPLVEEILFRALGQDLFLRKAIRCIWGAISPDGQSGKVIRVLTMALLFASSHTGSTVSYMGGYDSYFPDSLTTARVVFALSAGLLFGGIKESHWGLAGALGAHMGANLVADFPTLFAC